MTVSPRQVIRPPARQPKRIRIIAGDGCFAAAIPTLPGDCDRRAVHDSRACAAMRSLVQRPFDVLRFSIEGSRI